MSTIYRSAARRAEGELRRGARRAGPGIEALGRAGHVAKAVVYLTVGVLALQVALGRGGETTDSHGALTRLAALPFGGALLLACAVGFVGYALWRAVQAVLDTDHHGDNPRGWLTRSGYLLSATVYASLAFAALSVLRGHGGGHGTTEQAQDWTARLLEQPFGPWVVALAGAAVIGSGLFQLYRAYSLEFRRHLWLESVTDAQERWILRTGRVGYAARGVVFCMVGVFVLDAAIKAQPDEARGLDGALAALAQHPLALFLLGGVAFGLACYAAYMLVAARYRRMVIA